MTPCIEMISVLYESYSILDYLPFFLLLLTVHAVEYYAIQHYCVFWTSYTAYIIILTVCKENSV